MFGAPDATPGVYERSHWPGRGAGGTSKQTSPSFIPSSSSRTRRVPLSVIEGRHRVDKFVTNALARHRLIYQVGPADRQLSCAVVVRNAISFACYRFEAAAVAARHWPMRRASSKIRHAHMIHELQCVNRGRRLDIGVLILPLLSLLECSMIRQKTDTLEPWRQCSVAFRERVKRCASQELSPIHSTKSNSRLAASRWGIF